MSTDRPPSFLNRLEKRMQLFAGVGCVGGWCADLVRVSGRSGTVSWEACTGGGEQARRETRTAPSDLGN